ncbi:MAG: ParB/RepB/Spo0J family partition protein [Caulobacterales bacterium]
MTTQGAPTIQRGVEITVPLGKLKKSPKNARKTPHAAADIEALAASIAVKGVLQSPVVEAETNAEGGATGAYLVTIGEGRRLALRLLAKRKVIAKTTPVRCMLDDTNDAFEVSLDENVTRTPMHPADQFEAFRELAETRGWSAEEIGARFGVAAAIVRQRLRLGAASPKLMAAYRDGELPLDQLMAFAISEDHERQEQVFDALSYNRSPSFIRRLLTENEVEAIVRRAQFVGVEAYEAAGGRIRRDLFAEDRGGWFEDVGLLERLALEKLEAEAERVRTEEGWRWAEAHLDYPQGHGLRRFYPMRPVQDELGQARLTSLADEYDVLVAGVEDGELPDETAARLAEIDAELQAAPRPVYDPEQLALAGVFVVLDWDGQPRIERGFVRAADETLEPTDTSAGFGEGKPLSDDGVRACGDVGPKPLSDRLIADLTAHRTAALRDALAGQPEAAFLAALHTLVVQTFWRSPTQSCLELAGGHADLAIHAEGYVESVAGRSIEGRHAHWAARLPKGPEDAWDALIAFPESDRMSLFAHCVSLTVNALRLFEGRAGALAHADVLSAHIGLNMTRYWRATAQSYFGRVSKAHILEAVREGKSAEAADKIEGLKKDAMADAAADLLGSEGWLPPLLRSAAAVPA